MKKKIVAIMLCALTLVSIVGCGSSSDPMMKYKKSELIDMYNDAVANMEVYKEMYLEASSGSGTSSGSNGSISSVGDGTNHNSITSYDSQIIFSDSFEYPDAKELGVSSSVSIVSGLTVSPGSNWTMKLSGTSLILEHSRGISGTISVGEVDLVYSGSYILESVLKPWIEQIPSSSVTYNNIFVDGVQTGAQAICVTEIDGDSAIVRAGIANVGAYAVTYVFVYRGTSDSTNEEVITSLVNSVNSGGYSITVE